MRYSIVGLIVTIIQVILPGQSCPTSYTVIPQTTLNLEIEASIVMPSFGSNVFMKLYDSSGNLFDTGIDRVTIPCRDEIYQLETISMNGDLCSFPVQIDPSFSGLWSHPQFIRSNQDISVANANFSSGINLRSAQSIELQNDVCIPAGSNSTLSIFPSSCESNIKCPSSVNFDIDFNGVSNASIGDLICVDILGSGINNLIAMQFNLVFNPNFLSPVSCSAGALASFTCSNIFIDVAEGSIAALWFDTTPQSIFNQSPLINICFEVITTNQVTTLIEPSSNIRPEFASGDPNDPSVTIIQSNLCSSGGSIILN